MFSYLFRYIENNFSNGVDVFLMVGKLLNQLFAPVSSCSKNFYTFKTFFTLIKVLKLQHVSILMDHPQGVRRT